MRRCLFVLLGLSLATGLGAQTSTAPAPATPSPGDSFSDLGIGNLTPAQVTAPTPAVPSTGGSFDGIELNPGSFSPSSENLTVSGINLQSGPAPELRTPAQLQAILNGYVGHWKGDYVVTSTGGQELSRFPIDVVYEMKKDKDGQEVLTGTTTYAKDGKTVTEVTRSWVNQGQIVAQVSHEDIVEKFSARTRGEDLVWFTEDTNKESTDFSMTETLKLTADGGTLSSKGFERVPDSNPPLLVYVTSELKKQPQ
jgi:hypothetical protein